MNTEGITRLKNLRKQRKYSLQSAIVNKFDPIKRKRYMWQYFIWTKIIRDLEKKLGFKRNQTIVTITVRLNYNTESTIPFVAH